MASLRRRKLTFASIFWILFIISIFYLLFNISHRLQQMGLNPDPINMPFTESKKSSIFYFSCLSFYDICTEMHLHQIYNLKDFNLECYKISAKLINNSLSRLFILSFRREYLIMLNNNNININTKSKSESHSNIHCNYYDVLLSLFDRKPEENILSLIHTHISKSMGSTITKATSKISLN